MHINNYLQCYCRYYFTIYIAIYFGTYNYPLGASAIYCTMIYCLQYYCCFFLYIINRRYTVVTINCNTIVDSLQCKLQLFRKLQLIYIYCSSELATIFCPLQLIVDMLWVVVPSTTTGHIADLLRGDT